MEGRRVGRDREEDGGKSVEGKGERREVGRERERDRGEWRY